MEYALFRFISSLFMEPEQIPIRRGRILRLDTCDITADELDILEVQGSDIGLDFQIAIFCITMASSFLTTLLVVDITSHKTYTVFVVLTAVGFIVGLGFGLKWFKNRKSFQKLIDKIRARQVGTVGEEGKEISAYELVTKPLQAAPNPAQSVPIEVNEDSAPAPNSVGAGGETK